MSTSPPPGPVLEDTSVLLLTFRHGDFVREAIHSLLHQSRPPGELIVSDDLSPDHTWDEIQAVAADYDGPCRLVIRQNSRRRGAPGNRYAAWQAATRRFIVYAHGDDMALPHRLERLHHAWTTTGASTLSSDAWHYWDGTRTDRNVVERCGDRAIGLEELSDAPFMPHLLGATLAMDRAVCERFPATMPPGDRGPSPGDLVLPFRGAMLGGHYYIDEPLIDWRRHPGQSTARYFHLEANNADAPREALETFFVFGLLQRMRDIQHYRQSPHDPEKARLAQRLTFNTWLKRVSLWAGARQRLEAAGWTQTWS